MGDREALANQLATSTRFSASSWLPFVDAALALGLDQSQVLAFADLDPCGARLALNVLNVFALNNARFG